VQVEVQVRRLRCGRPGCAHRIFAERLPAVAGLHAQRTARLGSLQHHIGLALGGKAGARLAERIGTPVSGATLGHGDDVRQKLTQGPSGKMLARMHLYPEFLNGFSCGLKPLA